MHFPAKAYQGRHADADLQEPGAQSLLLFMAQAIIIGLARGLGLLVRAMNIDGDFEITAESSWVHRCLAGCSAHLKRRCFPSRRSGCFSCLRRPGSCCSCFSSGWARHQMVKRHGRMSLLSLAGIAVPFAIGEEPRRCHEKLSSPDDTSTVDLRCFGYGAVDGVSGARDLDPVCDGDAALQSGNGGDEAQR